MRPKIGAMKIQSIIGSSIKGPLLGLIGIVAVGLLAGCECAPPVRESRIEKRIDCGSCARASVIPRRATTIWNRCPPLNPPIPNRCTSALQEYPDGIHHLAGGPLYYEPQNLNWEQAPPFGRW